MFSSSSAMKLDVIVYAIIKAEKRTERKSVRRNEAEKNTKAGKQKKKKSNDLLVKNTLLQPRKK